MNSHLPGSLSHALVTMLDEASKRDQGATMTFVHSGKVWTADELFAMTPNERYAVVQESIVTDIDKVPADLLEQARSDIRSHIADVGSAAPPTAP